MNPNETNALRPSADVPSHKKPSPVLWWMLAAIAILIGACCVGAAFFSVGDDGKTDALKFTPPTTTSADAPARTKETQPPAPTPADFKLTVKTVKQECFGSAGCLVTFRVEVDCQACRTLKPGTSYQVTYAVEGAEDPFINTFETAGASYVPPDEQMVSTKNKSAVLTAKVTEVSA